MMLKKQIKLRWILRDKKLQSLGNVLDFSSTIARFANRARNYETQSLAS